MNAPKKILAFLLFFLVLTLSPAVFSSQLMSLHGKITSSGSLLSSGDLRVYIYSASTGGTLVYDSGTDFDNTVSNGIVDVMLGSGAASLDLNYGTHYYLDLSVEGTDLDFDGSERKEFEASTGTLQANNLGTDFNAIYARKNANETITGNWNFGNTFANGGISIQNGILYAQSIIILNDLNAATVTAVDINGNYTPSINNQWNFGSTALRWAGIFGTDVNATTASIGTLTLANPLGVAYGGTGSSSFSSGRVPFSNGTILTSDGNLFWDNTNKRLGVGTSSPQNGVNIVGDFNIINSGTATSPSFIVRSTDGNIGINTAGGVGYRVDVNGNTKIRGDLNISNRICNDVNCYTLADLNTQGSGSISTPVSIANGGTGATTAATASSAIGVRLLGFTNGETDANDDTPSFMGQLGVASYGVGGGPFMYYATNTTKGSWMGAFNFPTGISQVGNPNKPEINDSSVHASQWHLNASHLGRSSSGDSGFTVGNWSSNPLNSGAGLCVAVMGVNSDGNAVLKNGGYVSSCFNQVPGNRFAGIIPGTSMLIFNRDVNDNKALAISRTGAAGFDQGNYSYMYFDFVTSLVRIPKWVPKVYQPKDISYQFTVSGITTAPSTDNMYRDDLNQYFTVTGTSLTGTPLSGTINATGLNAPHGTVLYRYAGSADSNITFSASVPIARWADTLLINPLTGRIGIDLNSPRSELDINGSVTVGVDLNVNNILRTNAIRSIDSNALSIMTSNTERIGVTADGNVNVSNRLNVGTSPLIGSALSVDGNINLTKSLVSGGSTYLTAGGSYIGYSAGLNVMTTTTIAAPASATADINYQSGYQYYAESYCEQYRVYAYKIVGFTTVYSSSYAETAQVCDDGSSNNYKVDVRWTAVSGASGYKIIVYSDYAGANFDYSYTASGGSTIHWEDDGSGSNLSQEAVVTPTSGYLAYGSAANILNVVGDVNVVTALNAARPSFFVRSADGNVGINTAGGNGFRLDVNGNQIVRSDLNVGIAKTQIRADGNITMVSPNGTVGNCGMTNARVFQCS